MGGGLKSTGRPGILQILLENLWSYLKKWVDGGFFRSMSSGGGGGGERGRRFNVA